MWHVLARCGAPTSFRASPTPGTPARSKWVSSSGATSTALSAGSASTRPARTPAPTSGTCGPQPGNCLPPRPSPVKPARAGSRSTSPTRCRSTLIPPTWHRISLPRVTTRRRPVTSTHRPRRPRMAAALSTPCPFTRSATRRRAEMAYLSTPAPAASLRTRSTPRTTGWMSLSRRPRHRASPPPSRPRPATHRPRSVGPRLLPGARSRPTR